MRYVKWVFFGVILAAVFAVGWNVRGRLAHRDEVDSAALIERIREVARLETLEVILSKTVTHRPDPRPATGVAAELASWAAYTWRSPEGKALVYGKARFQLDLAKLDASSLAVRDGVADVVLPPVRVWVELMPERTTMLASNLDGEETTELFAKARTALEVEAEHDAGLREKARISAENAIRRLLVQAGLREVRFPATLPAVASRM